MSYPLVYVEWEDAASVDGWGKISDFTMGPHLCVTVGFIIEEDNERMAIASTTGDGDACCIMILPRTMIHRVTPLSPPEP